MIGVNETALLDMCKRIKQMGYGPGCCIRMYGERLEVLSDPFPNEKGIAIKARSKDDQVVRVVNLPATILQSVREKRVTTSA